MARALTRLMTVALFACKSPSVKDVGAPADSSVPLPIAWPEIEANRDARAISEALLHSSSVEERRMAVRATARIGDATRIEVLFNALRDNDEFVVAFAAHGLGTLCRAKPDTVTPALVTRLTTLLTAPASVLRALGQCDTPEAEASLAAQLEKHCDDASLALGDIANRKSALSDNTHAALNASPCAMGAALYPYARMKTGASIPSAKALAKRAINEVADARIWAIIALGRAGETIPLAPIVTSSAYKTNERVEAAKHLVEHAPAKADEALSMLSTNVLKETFHILTTLVRGKPHKPSKAAARALFSLVTEAKRLAEANAKMAHRWQRLSCDAALQLAQGDADADVLKQCAPTTSLAWAKARLASRLSKPIHPSHIGDFVALSDNPHTVVREEAIEGLSAHSELAGVAPDVVARALESDRPGLVATAATLIHRHPHLVLTEGGKVASRVEAAINVALVRPWPSDATETATALVDAVKSLNLPSKPEFDARWRCHPAEVVRQKMSSQRSCEPSHFAFHKALHSRFRIRSTAGDLFLSFDTKAAPIASARFEELAERGFFNGTKVHRVVPGFVAQFGDPQSKEGDGDGYGGAGTTMPCETSPVPFAAFDIGVAIAGRDTGSSQFFVTLARTPHLDGAYSWVGKASGPWHEVIEGDLVEAIAPVD